MRTGRKILAILLNAALASTAVFPAACLRMPRSKPAHLLSCRMAEDAITVALGDSLRPILPAAKFAWTHSFDRGRSWKDVLKTELLGVPVAVILIGPGYLFFREPDLFRLFYQPWVLPSWVVASAATTLALASAFHLIAYHYQQRRQDARLQRSH